MFPGYGESSAKSSLRSLRCDLSPKTRDPDQGVNRCVNRRQRHSQRTRYPRAMGSRSHANPAACRPFTGVSSTLAQPASITSTLEFPHARRRSSRSVVRRRCTRTDGTKNRRCGMRGLSSPRRLLRGFTRYYRGPAHSDDDASGSRRAVTHAMTRTRIRETP